MQPLACTTLPEGWKRVEESSLTASCRARLARLYAPAKCTSSCLRAEVWGGTLSDNLCHHREVMARSAAALHATWHARRTAHSPHTLVLAPPQPCRHSVLFDTAAQLRPGQLASRTIHATPAGQLQPPRHKVRMHVRTLPGQRAPRLRVAASHSRTLSSVPALSQWRPLGVGTTPVRQANSWGGVGWGGWSLRSRAAGSRNIAMQHAQVWRLQSTAGKLPLFGRTPALRPAEHL